MIGRRVAPLGCLFAAALAYLVVAWPVPPGFFDGLEPPGPYRWVSPPPTFRHGNQAPLAGHTTIPVQNDGAVPAGTAFTRDGQASISWSAGTFEPLPGQSDLVIRILPRRTFPNPAPARLSTNVYCVMTGGRLEPDRSVVVTLTYSAGIQVPTQVYTYRPGDAGWHSLGGSRGDVAFTISARATALTCFAGGVPTRPVGLSLPSGPLPVTVGALVVLLLLAVAPILLRRLRNLRRRPPRPVPSKRQE